MCVSMYHADLTNTLGMVNIAHLPDLGEVTVIGYQNNAKNLNSEGANAMILHFPAAEPMQQQNFVDTTLAPNFLKDMQKAIMPVTRGAPFGQPKSLGIQVFSYGIYTVVLVEDANLLAEALGSNLIPEERRPAINKEVFAWYQENMQGNSFALCCFNERQSKEATPIMVYYKAQSDKSMVFPGLDAHTGRAPELGVMVDVDHTLFLGSYKLRAGISGHRVNYTDHNIGDARDFLPNVVSGKTYKGQMWNGDFIFDRKQFESTGSMSSMYRGV